MTLHALVLASVAAATPPQVTKIITLISTITTWLLAGGGALAALMFAYGAIIYMSASGNPRQIERAKSAMFNAVIGLALVLSATGVAALIKSTMAG